MMSNLESLESIGTNAVKKLRLKKLRAGQPFMINSKELPSKQSYMEFPDHSIRIVSVAPDTRSFITISKLSQQEADSIRRRFNLL